MAHNSRWPISNAIVQRGAGAAFCPPSIGPIHRFRGERDPALHRGRGRNLPTLLRGAADLRATVGWTGWLGYAAVMDLPSESGPRPGECPSVSIRGFLLADMAELVWQTAIAATDDSRNLR